MGRESLRTIAGWRMYDQANLIVLVLLGLLFLLATQLKGPRAPVSTPTSTPASQVTQAPPAVAAASAPARVADATPVAAASAVSVDAASAPVAAAEASAPAARAGTQPSPAIEQCAVMASGLQGGFVPGKAELSLEGRQRLDLLVPCLTGVRYELAVHTDSRGNAAANLALTEARAKAAAAHLVGRGVPADKLEPRGKGSSEPAASNDTEDGRKANRRLTITPL